MDQSSHMPLIKSQSKHMILGSPKAHIRTPTSNNYSQNNDSHKSIYILKHKILGSWEAHIRTPISNSYTQNNDPY